MPDQHRPSWAQPKPGEPSARTRPKLEGRARSDAIKGCSCFTVIIAGVVVGAVVLFSGGSSKPASAAVTVAAAPATSDDGVANPVELPPTPTTAPAAAVATSVPSPTIRTSTSTAGAVSAWYKGGGNAWIATLSADVASVTMDSRSGDSGDLNADCMRLSADEGLAQSYAAVPNAWAQLSWSSALTTLHQGWWNCNGGFSDNSTTEVSNAVVEIESAGPLLTATTQRIRQAKG